MPYASCVTFKKASAKLIFFSFQILTQLFAPYPSSRSSIKKDLLLTTFNQLTVKN